MSILSTIADRAVSFAKLATSAVATAAQFCANAANKLVSVSGLWGAAAWVDLGNCTGTATVDLSTGINFRAVVTGACLFNFTNGKDGQTFVLRFAQDATGAHAVTFEADGTGTTAFAIGGAAIDWNDDANAANYFSGQIFTLSDTKYIYYTGARLTA